jgi:phage tail sheath protein FI
MGNDLRTLGVIGKNAPTKRSLTVGAAPFNIGGMLCKTERKYNKAFAVESPDEFREIYGNQVNPLDYGPDAVTGFFDNVVGASGTLYIANLLGYDGAAIDAVVASADIADAGADADALQLQAAYQEELEYGTSGNRTGYSIVHADRFATAAAATVAATGVSTATLDSVAGISVGDIILFKTNGGASPVYKKVTAVDEGNRQVSWSGDFEVSGASGETLAVDDEVTIPGFQLKTYRKSTSGIVTEVETELGKIVCSMESEVTDFYVNNVHATNRYIKVSEGSASTLGDRIPVANATPAFMTGGAEGTTTITAAMVDEFLTRLNNLPVRFIAMPESSTKEIQARGEAYCAGRDDTPMFIITLPENQTKAQLITLGNFFQRSDDVFAAAWDKWLEVPDPFATTSVAPPRKVPNVGHVMGNYIRSISQLGIHQIPAQNATPLFGAIGLVGEAITDRDDRTDVAEAGVNVINQLPGVGFRLMNAFTLSTDVAVRYANGIIMRNFLKISAEDSLRPTENEPNSINRIFAGRDAVLNFLYALWSRGSTGSVPEGETFAQTLDEAGELTGPTEAFQVVGDLTNNPQAKIEQGERNYDITFTYPAPAGSIQINVGIRLRG